MITSAMESMYRYRVSRIWNELQDAGKLDTGLMLADLIPLDQYHYLSTAAVDEAARRLQIDRHSRVLDIGSGVGGTARYLAVNYGCSVTGLELQPHLYEASVELTQRLGLGDRVQFCLGDFLQLDQLPIAQQTFHHWVSLLVFLHIGDRQKLFRNCAQVLEPGGRFYIEDYFQRRPLTDADQTYLKTALSCPHLPTQEQYQADLTAAGFVDVEFQDVTELWLPWVRDRAAKFAAQKDDYTRIHGAEAVASFQQFYQVVSELFAAGNVGGLRIWGRFS
jgi:sarcosine/dimethylglycine N-methyltransferase